VLGTCYVLNKYSLDEKVWELEVILWLLKRMIHPFTYQGCFSFQAFYFLRQ
jgi:hypothetical protein